MGIKIRKAVKEDCTRLLELITELAVYEKAPQEVTVTLPHFEESGFGQNPVWWAFVAESDGKAEGLRFIISATLPGKASACTWKILL